MIPDELKVLVLADSLDALDRDERARLEVLLHALAPHQRVEVSRLYDAATAAATSMVPPLEPPPHVRARLLSRQCTHTQYTVRGTDPSWTEIGVPGIRVRVLAVNQERGLVTLLVRAEPGAVYPAHTHHGPEDCYVIRGSVEMGGRVLHAGDFHHADEDSEHGEITTTEGAEVLMIGAIEDYLPRPHIDSQF